MSVLAEATERGRCSHARFFVREDGVRCCAFCHEPVGAPMAEPTGIACGGTECPTCGRHTEALLGPCVGCCESHARTGNFLRRLRTGASNG